MFLHEVIAPHPEHAPAIRDDAGATLTYGALRHAVDALASGLVDLGLRPGDRLMLVGENCAAYVVAILAASQVGAWVMPINGRHKPLELQNILDHSGARLILMTDASHAAHFAAQPFGAYWTAQFDATPEPKGDTAQTRVAAMMYTTGTTSAPKGVMLSHENLLWNAALSVRLRGLSAADQVLGVLPLSHIFGFASTLLATLTVGAEICLLRRFDPQHVLDALARGASALPAVPQMYARILAHMDQSGAHLSAPKLHYISAGGAPLDPDLKTRVEAVFGLVLNNGYGITEAAPSVAATRPDAPREDVSVGPALWGVTVTIDTPDTEGVGEILVESPGVMLGYYRDAEETARALPRPGLFRTGDLGRVAPDGALFIEGRKKELIIRSGFNVYPPEIEAMLTRHPDVDQAAVVPRRRAGNEDILAFVILRNGLTETALGDWLRPRLVAYKLPQVILAVASLPAAPTGKILKHKLIAHFATQLAAREKDQ